MQKNSNAVNMLVGCADGQGRDNPFEKYIPTGEGRRLVSSDGVSVTELFATDTSTRRPVMLHVYPSVDSDSLMREADAMSELEEICYGREGVAEVPELIDAHISENEACPICYLVFSANPSPITLADYLAGGDLSSEYIYSRLACALNTLAVSIDMGMRHGSLDASKIELCGEKVILHGMNIWNDLPCDADLQGARALIKKIDRILLSRGKLRRGRAEALFALERLKYFFDIARRSYIVR